MTADARLLACPLVLEDVVAGALRIVANAQRASLLAVTKTNAEGEGSDGHGTTHTKKLYLRKGHFFGIEKYIEDLRQDQKHVPGLLESKMRPTFFVKEEFRPILFKITQFGSKAPKMKVSTFWIPEIQSFPAGGQCQPSRQ